MRFLGPYLVLALAAAPLQAQSNHVSIASAIFVEREEGAKRTVEPAQQLRQGERVVTVLRWTAPRGSYTVTSPVPGALQFERSSAEAIEASIDGGRSWRALAQVQPEAVTHLRWRVSQGSGRLSYSAIVR